MPFEFQAIATLQILWVLVSIWHFVRRSDEVPLLASLLIGYYSGYRMWTLLAGVRELGSVANLGFQNVDEVQAFRALYAIAFGQSLLLGTYMLVQNRAFVSGGFTLAPLTARRLQSFVVTVAMILIPVAWWVKGYAAEQFMGGFALQITSSAYIRLFPLVLSTLAIMLIFLWRFGGLDSMSRLLNLGLVGVLFYLTYASQGRFQFLAWLVAGGLVVSAAYRPVTRLLLLTGFLALAAMIFAVAGVQRQYVGEFERIAALDRIIRAEDANMLEGFALMQQVIPSRFGYRYGMEHLETIIRPIPRAWWPNKPVGNYMLRAMGIDESRPTGTIGISPSLFGSFFVEGGYVGIVVLSLLYGVVLGRFMRWAAGLHPAPGLLVRGLVCASLVPLLRGGDLAGIFAVLVMSFWPFLLLLVFRRKELAVGSRWFEGDATAEAMPTGGQRGYLRSGRRRTAVAGEMIPQR